MRVKRFNKRTGVTIAEVIVATMITVLVIGAGYAFYVMAKDVWLHVFVQTEMQNDAMLATEKMIYGLEVDALGSRKGIQESQDVLVPPSGGSGPQIEFVDPDDTSVTRLFFQSGDTIVYTDGNDVNTVILDQGVQSLLFTRPVDHDDLVLIGLVLERTVRGRAIRVELNTSTRLRNI